MSDQQRQDREHRVFRRTELSTRVEIEVEDLGDGAPTARVAEGQIVNVGVGGLLARLSEGMPVGTLCTVRFVEPEAGELEARGYVRRLLSDEGVGFLVGIEFETALEALRTPSEEDRLEGFDLASTKVLVVDDEPSVVELLYRFLTSRGCEVHTASSGEEALRQGAADFISKPLDLKYLEWSMQLHHASC